MSTVVRCKVSQCKYNGGLFCTKQFVFLDNGVCNVLMDKNGQWRNPAEWQKPYGYENPENDEKTVQTT